MATSYARPLPHHPLTSSPTHPFTPSPAPLLAHFPYNPPSPGASHDHPLPRRPHQALLRQ
jgi:hypothetical protein